MYQLIKIATGEKTVEQSREENRAAVQKHRVAKRKEKPTIPLQAPVMESRAPGLQAPQEPVGEAHPDPDASDAYCVHGRVKGQVGNGNVGVQSSGFAGEPKPDQTPSEQALSECRASVDTLFPLMNGKDRTTLLEHARTLNVKLHGKDPSDFLLTKANRKVAASNDAFRRG
jgi:hypothetical protein